MLRYAELPFVPARDFRKGRTDTISLIVIHDAECAETSTASEDLGSYGRHPDYTSSWHVSVDNNSGEVSVRDSDTAFAAPPVNPKALHIELAGYMRQSREQWLDEYSKAVIDNAASIVAEWCLKYNIPVLHLTNDQLAGGQRGIVGHYQVSTVWKKSDHVDPGSQFPWDYFMERVVFHSACRDTSK